MSSGLRFVFFSRGRTIVAFSMLGKLPSSSDMLHIFVIVPARSGTNRLMNHVGAGSNMQCFAGDAPTIFKISSAVTGRKLNRAGNCGARSLVGWHSTWTNEFCWPYSEKSLQNHQEKIYSPMSPLIDKHPDFRPKCCSILIHVRG